MFKFILVKLGELVSSSVVGAFMSKVVDRTTDNALDNINTVQNFDLNFKALLQDLKSLSAMTSDLKEQIKNQELSGRKKRKRQVEEWLERVISIEQEAAELETRVDLEGYIARLGDGGIIAKMNERVLKLVEQSRDFGKLVLDVRGSSGETLLTNGMAGKAFHENLETIMQLLETRQVSSIGVYGMGGVGKTTLAKHINNRLLQQSERSVFWVTVSQEFTVTGLQDKIARLLGADLSDEDEVGKRAMRLHRALSRHKNSVLILDDVWENIDLLEVGCPVSRDHCRLVITTRSLEVCRRICCEKVIRVEKLGEEEALKLFNETLGNGIELGPQVEEIAKSVGKLCDGLPLAIITVAGSMRGERAIHTWKNTLAELQDGVGDIKVFRVLKYSFDRLKRSDENESNELNVIQRCFMYCSLYPEDYAIVRYDLVRNFISDGLVDERRSRKAQVEQGHSILDKLTNVCLLESCVNYKNEESVKMHDLVRDMALKIGEGKYMVRAGKKSFKEILHDEEWTEDLEKVSFMQGQIWRIKEGLSPNCPKLSTLLLSENHELKVIPQSFFSRIQGLCTLNLCFLLHIAMLPNSISDMKSLKSLLLENCCRLHYVPYLGRLKALRELNLSGTGIKEAPQGLEELLNLRFLSMNARGLKIIPRGLLLKLGHLQHLNLPLHIQIEEIKNLKQLEEFRGGLENVSDFNWFITTSGVHDSFYRIRVSSNISFHLHVLFMQLASDVYPRIFGVDDGWRRNKNELVLCGCNLKDEKVLGRGIAFLTIIECEGLSKCFVDDLSEQFNNPTSLRKLIVWRCQGMEWILRSDDGQFSNTLQVIDLRELDGLKGVVRRRGEIGASTSAHAQPALFFSLKGLYINGCNKMRKVGLPVSGLPNLEQIYIYGCGEIEEIFGQGEGVAASVVFTTFPKLQVLHLDGLPRLKRLSKATLIICNSIEIISIRDCPRLMKRLPLHFDDPSPPPTLRSIKVEREWWESLDWDSNPNLPLLLHPFVRFL